MPDSNDVKMLQARQHYAGLGIRTHQLVVNGKKPRAEGWQHNATTDELGIEAEFSDLPNANFGMPTDGLLIVDTDGNDNAWLQSLAIERRQELFDKAAFVTQTWSGGLHFGFTQPVGRSYRNTTGKIADKVDTRANGGFVVCVGSVVNGRPYTFLAGYELTISPDKWSTPPAWLLEMLDSKSVKVVAQDPGEVCEGGRQAYLVRTAGYLRRGGLNESEILACLRARNQERCKPPLPDHEVVQTAKSVAVYEPDQISELIVEGCDPGVNRNKATDPGAFPSNLLNVPGFVRRVMDFNLQGAFIQQPELALAGIVSLMAMLLGQKIQDEQHTRTNLYCVGLGDSGEGKDHAMKVNRILAQSCGMSDRIHGEPASSGGMLSAITGTPVCLFQIDEIGRFLRSIQNSKSQPWMAEVVSVFLSMFSCADSEFISKVYAKEKAARINQPCVSLYGVSVPQSVWQSMTIENMTDGFLSRLLIFEAANDNPMANRYPNKSPPCDEIIEELAYWRDYSPGGNLSHLHPQPRTIQYGTDVSELFWSAFTDYRLLAKSGVTGATLWTRALEKAKKLALIYQCSKDRNSELIEIDAATWGLDVVNHLTKRMLFLAENWIADGQVGTAKASILRFMLSHGKRATTSELLKSHRGLNAKGLQELMETLLLEGVVQQREEASGGKPRRIYEMVS